MAANTAMVHDTLHLLLPVVVDERRQQFLAEVFADQLQESALWVREQVRNGLSHETALHMATDRVLQKMGARPELLPNSFRHEE